jgi:hypothetical protein
MVIEREYLINLCEKAIVNEEKWRTLNSFFLQQSVGELWMLLKSGCEYRVELYDELYYVIDVAYKGVDYFEGEENGNEQASTHVLPTIERLKAIDGDEWYEEKWYEDLPI